MSPEKRSALMARIRGKDTGPEIQVRALLKGMGLRAHRQDRRLPGRPDFALWSHRIAVFVDGDFWHGWRFPLWKGKLSRFWQEKIETNRKRDARNFRKLRRTGWAVLRIWEHQVESDIGTCQERILGALRNRRNLVAR